MEAAVELLVVQVEGLALDQSVTPTMFCLVGFLVLHWLLTRRSFPLALHNRNDPGVEKRDSELEQHIMEEQGKVLARSWKKACYIVVHLHVSLICVLIYECFRKRDAPSLVWLVACMVVYVALLDPNHRGSPEITARRASCEFAACFLGWLACLVSSAWENQEDFVVRRDLLRMAQTVMVIIYPEKKVASCFAACSFVGYIWTTWSVCGSEALNVWFVINQIYQIVIIILFSAFTQLNHRECILMAFNSQDADSLVSAFRQVLKAVCDGDLLLDDGLKICAGSSCLKRLLESPEDATGRAFVDLLVQDEKTVKTFEDFVRDSAEAAQRAGSAAQCLRVAFKGTRRLVPADVFHVALPKTLGLSSGRHLLAIAEDADSRSIVVDDGRNSIPSSLLSSRSPSTGTAPSVTSFGSGMTENIQLFEELSQLTLTLNATTELIDVAEVHMRFTRHSDEDKMELGMPCLKKFIRPLDWLAIEAKLRKYAQLARKELPAQKKLAPLMFRIPGDSRTFLRARSVSLKSVYSGPRPAGQPAFLHLTLSKFNEDRRTASAEPSSLTRVEEASRHKKKPPAVPSCSDEEDPGKLS